LTTFGVVSKQVRLQRIVNPSVETGAVTPDDWFYGGQAFWSEDKAYWGKKSLLIDVSNQTADWRTRPFDVKAGKKYYLQAYFTGTVESGEFFLTIRWFRQRGGVDFISENNIPIPVGSYPDWTKFSGEFTAPAEAVSADVLFRVPTPSTGKVYGDEFICLSEPYTETRVALEIVGSPFKIAPNPVDPYAHACVYIYRVKQFAPAILEITFRVTGETQVEVFDAENNRFLLERQTIVADSTFPIEWDGRGVFEPRVAGTQINEIEVVWSEKEIAIPPSPKSLAFHDILAALQFMFVASICISIIKTLRGRTK